MKFSEQWLREWVDPPVTTAQLAEQLTMAGIEVEAITPAAPPFTGVIVAEVQTVKIHPESEHLKVCTVSHGTTDPITVVCGAPNVRAGMKAPLACVGAKLPRDLVIERALVRGIASEGMLCSAAELGLAESAEGLLELPQDAPVGQPLWDFFQLGDRSLELKLTPNRGDCLGLAGVAREVGVLNQTPLKGPAPISVAPAIQESFPIEILAPEACPRYAGRVVRNIDSAAQTPLWMKERLRRSGLRGIHPVVDITNYVMLELGQPMHAFDLARLQGGIQVRRAREGEAITLLDGQELRLNPDTLVIADHTQAVAMAGIMGGAGSAVTSETQDIFFESAFFSPDALAGQARRYRLQTDSSYRFERGVDFELQVRAIERATERLVGICGGQPGPVSEQCSRARLPQRQAIQLRAARIRRLLGMEFAAGRVEEILRQLGMEVRTEDAEGWRVTPPSFRFDISMEADLIEEVARVGGYNAIPSHCPKAALTMRPRPEGRIDLSTLRGVLAARGYQEAITYSFVDPVLQGHLDPQQQAIALANPIASDMAVMRTSLWPGLIGALLYNRNRQSNRIRLFETGLVFRRENGEIHQQPVIGGVASGFAYPEQWGSTRREMDFADLKGDVESLLAVTGRSGEFEARPTEHPALHPGQSAVIEVNGKRIGLLGALHPSIAKELDLPQGAFLFQLDLGGITTGQIPRFSPLSKFPLVRRDIALVVDRSISTGELIRCIQQAAPCDLKDLVLFDLYLGEGIDSKKKSLALGLIFQGASSTLIDTEVNTLVEGLVSRLEQELGATLRN
jgi:phenylalanyl-tRNA synthetase beta chain